MCRADQPNLGRTHGPPITAQDKIKSKFLFFILFLKAVFSILLHLFHISRSNLTTNYIIELIRSSDSTYLASHPISNNFFQIHIQIANDYFGLFSDYINTCKFKFLIFIIKY